VQLNPIATHAAMPREIACALTEELRREPPQRPSAPSLAPSTAETRRKIASRRDYALTSLTAAATIIFGALSTADLVHIAGAAIDAGDGVRCIELAIIYIPVYLLLYGSLIYHIAEFGQIRRQATHAPVPLAVLERIHDRSVPNILVLVPSYRENDTIIRQTLVSAALLDYPGRTVALLIDDPPSPASSEEAAPLDAARRLPSDLQARFAAPAARLQAELDQFVARRGEGTVDRAAEATRLASLYEGVAAWLETEAGESAYRKCKTAEDHTDRLFHDAILMAPAQAHRARAAAIRQRAREIDEVELGREYRRLAAVFRVRFESFERKRYANLSHESNKAMNLNSYLALIGRGFREVEREGALHLEFCAREEATRVVERPDYVITLDADTMLLSDYALRLVHIMEQPGNHRLAVAQTPYSAVPGATGLERLAGVTTDVTFLCHQGSTYFDAASWVGSNALLRARALDDIATERMERGHPVKVFIQDKTVIEDTGATIDLILKGWHLHSYPERLAHSATPPDFGALLIQRRRWANGGLILVPDLMRFAVKGRFELRKLIEVMLRLYYLVSTTVVGVALLTLFLAAFDDKLFSLWLPLAASPYQIVYGYDLWRVGGRWRDIPRIYALNMVLFPVHLGGTAQCVRQMITGRKAPFARTPKVPGRTAVPLAYLAAEYALLVFSIWTGVVDLAQHKYFHLVFTSTNSAAFLYGIWRYIGFRNSWQDVTATLALYWSGDGLLARLWSRLRQRGSPLMAPIAPAMASTAQSPENR
jgi:cellulose synthase/poly-beta-1,6-N-acetylglucosamine synthase-like glycosyltransferase